ncbi:MAG TPA: tRNA lysidine(34) synthetase TilS, partial [Gammaproteobacteria bacterium]|nr:tRNA lysidine(34) synthetase TilS [Gammaproteobacteria bacterium]
MESLFKSFIDDTQKHYWVAFSGGLDSHVLLHALTTYRSKNPFSLKAIHIHHGLSPNADDWLTHCENVCRDLSLECISLKITIDSSKNIEEIARQKRYEIFQKFLATEDVLFTAHHEDDQAETVLLQLLRGAGTKGLSAMPVQKKLGRGVHIRPFLNVSRDALKKYALENQLSWIEDESNLNTDFSRNFLRHDIFPLLKKHWPSAHTALARSAKHCAEVENLLQEFVRQDLHVIMNENQQTLSIQQLKTFSKSRQTQIFRAWLQLLNLPLPSERKMEEIHQSFLSAAPDRFPLLQFGNVELRRYRDEIFAMPVLTERTLCGEYTWDFNTSLILPQIGELTIEKKVGEGLHPSIQEVSVRFREGGEYCYFRNCHQELKKLFQTWGVPPWLRSR